MNEVPHEAARTDTSHIGRVDRCVIGPCSSAIFAEYETLLPPGVQLRHYEFLDGSVQPADDRAVLWWCVIDASHVSPELCKVALQQRERGAITLIFVLGEAPDLPSDCPAWFELQLGRSHLALCPESIVWSSLGNTSHFGLDWNDLRSLSSGFGKGYVLEHEADNPATVINGLVNDLRTCSFAASYLHFEGCSVTGKTLKQVCALFRNENSDDVAQLVSYDPATRATTTYIRALLFPSL